MDYTAKVSSFAKKSPLWSRDVSKCKKMRGLNFLSLWEIGWKEDSIIFSLSLSCAQEIVKRSGRRKEVHQGKGGELAFRHGRSMKKRGEIFGFFYPCRGGGEGGKGFPVFRVEKKCMSVKHWSQWKISPSPPLPICHAQVGHRNVGQRMPQNGTVNKIWVIARFDGGY